MKKTTKRKGEEKTPKSGPKTALTTDIKANGNGKKKG